MTTGTFFLIYHSDMLNILKFLGKQPVYGINFFICGTIRKKEKPNSHGKSDDIVC
jgi:hypothetical protein